ncbi:carboxypeptidase-like regulatory domain-containing protein [Pricia sp. S334]|uniref:Carboxypeptidase-like regulatory domain-containing protein n=1 Tax=Pricia mediterranea TaxID=3076079 RepID=A0ABU3L827_9FLAO|nr:carboxypeptidase-like regulatory domain-containing protein [Pricia sp. S334]MDT7829713.1 carboxypeptidase-like regulatory domain-containing protein [Pricia sp. S334]
MMEGTDHCFGDKVAELKSPVSLLAAFVICFLFFMASAQGQEVFSDKLDGRVYSDDGDVAATHVLNITSQRATITDSNGYFTIPVRLNDTLVFSAVQYKRKELPVTLSVLESKLLLVPLEEARTELDEVVVTPYNLSGDVKRDLARMDIGPVVTASTLGLPNAYVKPISKAERELYAATANPFMSLDPLINTITGRKKMLKKRVARNEKYARTERVRQFYVDSLYTTALKIPPDKVDDFLYFCEVDPAFQSLVDTHDRLAIWEFMRKKSLAYLKRND